MVINAPALVVTAPTQMTSLSLSTLSVSSIVDYNFTSAGAIQASAISSSTGAFLSANLSTFNFNASAGGVNLGGINLGMGGFLGGLVGELVSGALTTTIAGAALGTGIAGLILPYTYPPGTSYPPGANISSFQTVNGTTQLQFSTLGTSTNTYYRYTSSIAGSDPTLTPNPLTFVSSVISPGTVCIRSFSDPINPANPSTFRSTLQSFGQWVPVPGSGGMHQGPRGRRGQGHDAGQRSFDQMGVQGAAGLPGRSARSYALMLNVYWPETDVGTNVERKTNRCLTPPRTTSPTACRVLIPGRVNTYSN